MTWVLTSIYQHLRTVPALAAIGPYGPAIIVLTVSIKLALSPITFWQLRASKKIQSQQKVLAPLIKEARAQNKGDNEAINRAVMKVYSDNNTSPAASLSGCLPAFIQLPILTALYWVFFSFAGQDRHFLFLPGLNRTPLHDTMFPGLPIPTLAYLVFPILAAATQWIQMRMMQPKVDPGAVVGEIDQMQQTSNMMLNLMPLMILYFAIVTPAAMGIYWVVGNLIAIAQQYFVTGWGQLPDSINRLRGLKEKIRLGFRQGEVLHGSSSTPAIKTNPQPLAEAVDVIPKPNLGGSAKKSGRRNRRRR